MAIKINGNTVIADNQAFTTTSTISATGNINSTNVITGNVLHAVSGNIGVPIGVATLLLGNNHPTTVWIGGDASNVYIANVNSTTRISGNLTANGIISATGNIDSAGVITGNVLHAVSGNIGVPFGVATLNLGNNYPTTINLGGNASNIFMANVNSTTHVAGNLTAGGAVSVTGNVTANNFIGSSAGNTTLSSATNLDLSANTAVRVTGGATFRLPSLDAAQIANIVAVNGDLIYNTTVNKIQGYEAGAWGNLI